MPSLKDEQVLLSESFTPSLNDVILGRGKSKEQIFVFLSLMACEAVRNSYIWLLR